jgi:hypothetical protein
MDEAFMADATKVLLAYMKRNSVDMDFKHGQLAVGLEIVSLIRTLESFPVVNDAERQGTVATLHTLLREQGLENAYEAYEMLAEWRRIKFAPVRNVPAPQGNGVAAVPRDRGLRVSVSAASSALDALGQLSARGDRPHAQLWERPSLEQGASPTSGQLALPFAAGTETPSG